MNLLKRTSGFFAVIMTAVMIAGCNIADMFGNAANDAQAKELVDSLFERTCSGKIAEGTYTDYFCEGEDNEKAFYELAELIDSDKLMNRTAGQFRDYVSESVYNELRAAVSDTVYGAVSYTITSMDKDSAEVVLTIPDSVKQGSASAEVDSEKLAQECFGFDVFSKEELLNAFLEKKNMTKEQFREEYASLNKSQIIKDLFAPFENEIKTYVKKVAEAVVNDSEKTEIKYTVKLQRNKDKSWRAASLNTE